MMMTNTMVCSLLVAQFRRFQILALGRLWGVAPCAPWGDGVEKAAWRGHLVLPVNRPEQVEARQCERRVVIIGEALKRALLIRLEILTCNVALCEG